jgi:hypothetical protein
VRKFNRLALLALRMRVAYRVKKKVTADGRSPVSRN